MTISLTSPSAMNEVEPLSSDEFVCNSSQQMDLDGVRTNARKEIISAATSTRPLVLHARVVTGPGGGPEKTILNSPRFLKELGYDCACAYMHPPGDPGFDVLRKRAAELDAELISLPDRSAVDVRVVLRLLRICRERNVAVWHAHDHKSNAIGWLLRRFHRMALVSTVHGWLFETPRASLYYKVDRLCLPHYQRVICVSDALFDECLQAGVPLDRCRVIENAIDLTKYHTASDRSAARRLCDLPLHGHVILAAGRLSPEKGFDVLIRAVDQLLESGCNLNLVIAGEGSERLRLEELIQQLGRQDRITLLGHQSELRQFYAAADAFVLSSHREGLPNVVLEALACGVPVVATAVGGVPRVLAHEHNGLLVSANDVGGLVVALSRLLHNDALKQQLAKSGRQTIEARYSFDMRMRKVAAVYDELLDRSGTCSTGRTVLRALARPAQTDREGSYGESVIVDVTQNPVGWEDFLAGRGYVGFHQRPAWVRAISAGLRHQSLFLQAKQGAQLAGVLPLQLVESRLFGRFLVSLPYVNTAGVIADSDAAATALVDRAIQLANALDVKHLELRHEHAIEHPKLINGVTDKVHMRLPLPSSVSALWDGLKAKVRNQVRKAQKIAGVTIHWGREELLSDFYKVFSHNMRDLGTPPFSRRLFAEILQAFVTEAELCVIRLNERPIASGLLIHGPGTTQVPSASSLREFNATNANMLLYWHLLSRAVERGQKEFDFGRSTRDSGTYRFKAQWGAVEHPAVWQHYMRCGEPGDMRPTSGRFQKAIQIWQRLPVWLTRLVGPSIVRGIP